MKKILLFTWCLLASSFSSVLAQIPEEPKSVQSPNAASLGLYGDVPVSHFTGVPNIEIPLYTLQKSHTVFPVSLSYHASGFRPDDHPGWVGMGWNLNAGGAISRSVNDEPDEYVDRSSSSSEANIGYFF